MKRNENQENQSQVACRKCNRRFHNNRGVINHLWFCNTAPLDDKVGRPPPLAAKSDAVANLNSADNAVAEQ